MVSRETQALLAVIQMRRLLYHWVSCCFSIRDPDATGSNSVFTLVEGIPLKDIDEKVTLARRRGWIHRHRIVYIFHRV
jgi:hypothetical protein